MDHQTVINARMKNISNYDFPDSKTTLFLENVLSPFEVAEGD